MSGAITLPAAEVAPDDYFDLRGALQALDSGAPVTFPPMHMTRVRIGGRNLTFCTNFAKDPVQRMQRKGRFYEDDDLREVAKFLPKAPRVLDVGANVGNHAMYFATQCGAESVVVIEPNPLALAPLVANILLNDLGGVIRTEALGIGLGAKSEGGLYMRRRLQNLGGTRMQRDMGGDLEVHPGDALFADEQFDLIKIDVEGMEMDVLAGLELTIARCRPLIFIEVDDENTAAFDDWCAARGYVPRYEVRRYNVNKNYLVQPVGETA
ncbi:FkbM family methyltransferase [Sagittula sp. S175]|uniref:FkbM family methyltransferase n=1 Tax=Sagittula sp. S175 TaxID=3415129 RepID=UPI003C7A1118